jgi:hypothetical protein
MLQRENELRLSDKVMELLENEATCVHVDDDKEYNKYIYSDKAQSYMDEANNTFFLSKVFSDVQEQVMKEFGYYDINNKNLLNYGLEMLHSALYLYPNDKEIINSVYYLKYNRAKCGQFKIGDEIIDIKTLLRFNQYINTFESLSLSQIVSVNDAIPTVVISGSMT